MSLSTQCVVYMPLFSGIGECAHQKLLEYSVCVFVCLPHSRALHFYILVRTPYAHTHTHGTLTLIQIYTHAEKYIAYVEHGPRQPSLPQKSKPGLHLFECLSVCACSCMCVCAHRCVRV